jgi:hypothetical protein
VGEVMLNKSMRLDGFITGPNSGPGQPLGEGGKRIFAWMDWAGKTTSATTKSSVRCSRQVTQHASAEAEAVRRWNAGLS